MQLSDALSKATNISELNDIFDNPVRIQLASYYDSVSVEGFEGTITSDDIAKKLSTWGFVDTDDSKHLANSLAEKVFKPLKILAEAPENYCAPYQFFVLKRAGYTPPAAAVFGSSIALKHAMTLGYLDSEEYFTG